MKRLIILVLTVVLVSVFLGGCTQGEFCNPELFAERYNELSVNEIRVEDYFGEDTKNGRVYVFEADEADGVKTVIRLFTDYQGRISECRIIISKLDENGKPVFVTSAAKTAFYEASVAAVCAFSGANEEEVEKTLAELLAENELSEKKTVERTSALGSQWLVFLSNEVVSEVVIYNKWLFKIEETLKPESKVAFDKTTNIRTETVPHK